MLAGTVSSKGQVTIPKEIRKILRVEPSDKVVFTPLGEGKALITSANRPASDVRSGPMNYYSGTTIRESPRLWSLTRRP